MKIKISPAFFFILLVAGSISAQKPDLAVGKIHKADVSLVPDSYSFSWKYTMEMQSGDAKPMIANYLLEKDAPYFGMNTPMSTQNMLMIMDTQNKINITTFNKGETKIAMLAKSPEGNAAAAQADHKKFTYRSLPEKTILKYKCKGVEATDGNYTILFYYTNDAPVNFADLFKAQQKMPEALKAYFKPDEKPLIMLAEMNDQAKGKKTTMKCTALIKEAFTFKKSDYKFM